MPRRKVRPEDRLRVAKACWPCKASKKRCDAATPCSNCVRKRSASACTYGEESRNGRVPTVARPRRRSSVGSVVVTPDNVKSNLRSGQQESQTRPDRRRVNATQEHLAPPSIPPGPASGRLLSNSQGEKVYVGGTASLSFLQFLRRTIRHQMGPSVFTENSRRHTMLEVQSPQEAHSTNVEADLEQKRAFIEVYFAATNGFLDLFSRDELDELSDARDAAPADSNKAYAFAALDVAVAIGGQCRASGPPDLQYAARYFSRAQKTAMAGGLEDPCLDMVRCFLSMAFYMFGACRRNAAFLYLGIASQASSALGLHVTEQYRHFSVREQGLRLRVMDVICSSILGRPYSTPAIRLDRASSFSSLHVHVGQPRDLALNASFGACSIVAEIMPHLDSSPLESAMAERFLGRLRDWSSSLPQEIRHFKRDQTSLSLAEQEQIIGSIHVSCVYYFAVMMVTRPFLISHLMARLPAASAAERDTSPDGLEESNLAQACIDSAVLMAQTCHDALQSGILLKNMCIMKAWMFAAGLVLGFSMFAQAQSFDMDESFNGAREVLRKLARHSPQAEHYYEILTGFADVIQRHRQRRSREKRRSSHGYVDQILSLDVKPTQQQQHSGLSPHPRSTEWVDPFTPETPAAAAAAAAAEPPADRMADFDFQAPLPEMSDFSTDIGGGGGGGGGFDFGAFGWDDLAVQITENFAFDTDDADWGQYWRRP